MTRHILIIFSSAYGQTAKIASRLQLILADDGLSVTAVNADTVPSGFDLTGFDGVVVGSSVIVGKHRKPIAQFVKRHAEALNRLPSAFYSVSGSAGSTDPRQQSDARLLMEKFLVGNGWNPDLTTTMGGALAYTRYSPFIRWIIRRIARKQGGPIDTTRDHELTNWEHVEDFAHRFARVVAPGAVPVASAPAD